MERVGESLALRHNGAEVARRIHGVAMVLGLRLSPYVHQINEGKIDDTYLELQKQEVSYEQNVRTITGMC